MNNSWTGGQYSIFRALLGTYLLVHFLHLLPWSEELFSNRGMIGAGEMSPLLHLFPNILAVVDNPIFVFSFISTGVIAAFFLLIGYGDRLAAFWIWYILACLFGRNPLIANPSLPYVGWMLLAHLFIPPSPYGSVAARGRANPDGNWTMPPLIYAAGWIILAISYSYSGYTKLLSPSWVSGDNISYVLSNPLARDYFLRDLILGLPPIFLKLLTWFILYLEFFFAPLALFRRFRPIIWGMMLFVQFGFAFLLNFFDLTAGMLLFHFFTFNPAWIKPQKSTGKEILFYDGNCGLCHRVIRFLLAEDRRKIIHFSPLQGSTIKEMIPEKIRKGLPDSIVIKPTPTEILTHSSAVIYLLNRLGGLWRILAVFLWLIPPLIRDAGYNFVGRIRFKIFTQPNESCPLISENLRDRFL